MEKTLTVPTIHLNGTPRGYLMDAYEAAARAVHEAERAVIESAPNARDYYVQSPSAYGQAAREHEARLAALRSVYDELVRLYESVEG